MHPNRIIGEHAGKDSGPLLICFGGMHGNEHAGVKAISLVSKMLEVEPITNPNFRLKGKFVGLRGNIAALEKNIRFVHKDMNRSFRDERIELLRMRRKEEMDSEDWELLDFIETIEHLVEEYQPERVIILDLHTTTAFGGIFTLASDDPESIRIGVSLHAPVITGFMKGVTGTTMHYFHKNRFPPIKTVTVVFESGQHDEPLSVNRAIAAIINCMRTIGMVNANDVENRHDQLLIEYASGLPKVAELIEWYQIEEGEKFRMMPNLKNFQTVQKGQVLAHTINGLVRAKSTGLLLMPKYQKQGDDGFFIIRDKSEAY